MRVGPRTVVTLEYDLYDADEQDLLESTKEAGEPLVALIGLGDIEPAFEKALQGKGPGDSFDVTLEPEDAYGYYDEALTDEIPLEEFPPDVKEGDEFAVFDDEDEADAAEEGEYAEEPQTMTVIEIDRRNGMAKVDYNHPYAGLRLRYKGKLTEVRAPDADELAEFEEYEAAMREMEAEEEEAAPPPKPAKGGSRR